MGWISLIGSLLGGNKQPQQPMQPVNTGAGIVPMQAQPQQNKLGGFMNLLQQKKPEDAGLNVGGATSGATATMG